MLREINRRISLPIQVANIHRLIELQQVVQSSWECWFHDFASYLEKDLRCNDVTFDFTSIDIEGDQYGLQYSFRDFGCSDKEYRAFYFPKKFMEEFKREDFTKKIIEHYEKKKTVKSIDGLFSKQLEEVKQLKKMGGS